MAGVKKSGLEEQIKESFIFETYDLARGNDIKTIQSELRDYAAKKGFRVGPVEPPLKNNSLFFYSDILSTIQKGKPYLSDFEWGEHRFAFADTLRLKANFMTNDARQWDKGIFQNIFDDVFDYVMKKRIYIECVDEKARKPPIKCYLSDFWITPRENGKVKDFITIDPDPSSKIIRYIEKKRKEYNEPGPRNKCETCLADCAEPERQAFKNLAKSL